MSSYYYPPLNNIIIHKIIFVHHYTIKIVHSYFDIYTLLDRVTFLEDIEILDTVFLKRAERKVKLDGTVTLNKQLYEVPASYIGQKIELRIDETNVYIFEDDKKLAEAVPISFHDNAHVKRNQSPFAIPNHPLDREGEDNV